MAVSIRLSRGGSKKRPYYRIVVADARAPRDGAFIEKVGTYNPMLTKDDTNRIVLNADRLKHWISVGAQPTDRVARFLDVAGIKERAARLNPKKAEPGEKAKERAEERAQKIIDEGTAQVRQVAPSLARLRLAAAQRVAEKTKPVEYAAELAGAAPAVALDAAVGRLHKQAVDLGYTSAHLIGSLRVSSAGLERPADLTAELRAAWSRRTGAALAAVPEEGYAYVPAVAPAAPALSKGLKPATAPKQLAVLWAEQYALTTDGSQALLFLRLADAHSFQLVASELVLVEQRAGGLLRDLPRERIAPARQLGLLAKHRGGA